MPQAIVNPEDLERFVGELKYFNSQLTGSMFRLQGLFSRLSDTWCDQEHQKFAKEFEQTMRELHLTASSSAQMDGSSSWRAKSTNEENFIQARPEPACRG